MPLYVGTQQYPVPMGFQPRRRLGALTPQQAAQQAMPKVSNTPGFTQSTFNSILQAAQTGNFDIPLPTSCTGAVGNPSGARLTQIAAVGSGAVSKIGLMIPALATGPGAIVVAGIAAAINIFGALFAHHAQAVKAEQAAICASVPAAMDGLTAIEQGVADGTVTPAQGVAMLNNLQQQFLQTIGPVTKNNSSQCNAGCVWTKMLQAIVLELTSQWQDQAAALQPSTGGSAAAVASSSVAGATPSWLPLAAAAGILFFVFSS